METNVVSIHAKTWINFEPFAKWKKPGTKDHILHNSISTKYPEEKSRKTCVTRFQYSYKAIVVKTVEYWHKEGQTNKERRDQK